MGACLRAAVLLLLIHSAGAFQAALLGSNFLSRLHKSTTRGVVPASQRLHPLVSGNPGLRRQSFAALRIHASSSQQEAIRAEDDNEKVTGVHITETEHKVQEGAESTWKDSSPQRTLDVNQHSYLNQFPNTWEPAERIAASAPLKASGGTISFSGLEFEVASGTTTYDAGIVGTGPAALALAAAMAAEGMQVALLGPVRGAWPNNYGVWLDEWEVLGLPESCVEHTYETTRITIGSANSIEIPRPYGKVSGPKTRQVLLERCQEGGVHVLEGIVTQVEHGGGVGPTKLHVPGEDGAPDLAIKCKVPVVAAGHYSPLVKYQSPGVEYMRMEGEYMTRNWDTLLQTPPDERIRIPHEHVPSGPLSQMSWRNSVQFNSVRPMQHAWGWNWGWNPALRGFRVPDAIPFFGGSEAVGGGAPGYQIAYGTTVETKTPHGFPLNEMLLMDFSTDHLIGDTELEGGVDGHVPTFLYAFPYDEHNVFLQETLLVARNHRASVKSLEMEELVRRVDKRVEHLGLEVVREYDKEYSVIPMGGPLPVLGQPTLAYGAAAVMVHPASGYMINRVILQAPEVAEAIAKTLRATGSPQEASTAGWEALWPKHRLIERDLYCFGMEVLLDLDVQLLRDFFAAFFADPKEQMWRQFLAWNMTKPNQKPWKMSIFMILQFLRGSWRLKSRLVKEAMFKDG
eukprot:CAMPEP_0181288368 /NCGR_PEP_ID=MMETSP1101-20121128/294_1 /TAXON_ID=46948 /ORGANISM="Rhodomonas abbreviata, Strain Caron Lab Isolate" /LENGTH=681 /DNA_ID=CAMNT_0023392483 /DNA_START=185 /DNA_END=2226 /DNA_ORIENTATION=-